MPKPDWFERTAQEIEDDLKRRYEKAPESEKKHFFDDPFETYNRFMMRRFRRSSQTYPKNEKK